jgi:CheY-like chemotaxis protein
MADQKKIILAVGVSPSWKAFASVLVGLGYDVVVARERIQVEKRLSLRRLDLMILDLDLPNEAGWRIAEWVNNAYPQLPVIATVSQPGQQLKAAMLGVDAVVEQPLETQDLVRAASQLLALAEQSELDRIAAALRVLKERYGQDKGVISDALEVEEVFQRF